MRFASMTRRAACVAISLGLLWSGGFIGQAGAAEMTAEERANTKLVTEFMDAWRAPDMTVEKLMAYFTDDCVVRDERAPAFVGREATAKAFDVYIGKGLRFDIKTLETYAKGSVVVNSRMDALIKDGKTGSFSPVVGVFVVKNGKIKEWSDFFSPKEEKK
jgi:limonene-1,2-epoxide hydrolase